MSRRARRPFGHAASPPLIARAACAACACLLALAGCDAPPTPLVFGGETMGTSYSVTLGEGQDMGESVDGAIDEATVERLARTVKDTLDGVNNRMSTYLEDSELSRFNQSRSTAWQPASAQLVTVLLEARRVSALSNGAFDVTVGPVVNLWGFGPAPSIDDVPTAAAIADALSAVDYRCLEVRETPPMIRKCMPRLYVDLSAIAKGYAVDEVAAVLAGAGITNSLVEIGGELYASGVNADGEPWRIGIEKPEQGARTALRAIRISGGGVATSGDYRIYTEIEGRRYHHEIDPHTGRPVTHSTTLVSVVASSAMEADALATALLVLGGENGLALARRLGIAAYFVERSDDGFVSSASPEFEARFAAGGGEG